MLSFDNASSANYISSRFVTKFLGEEIQPVAGRDLIRQAQSLSHEAVKGYVDLEWSLENNLRDWHIARFMVTTSADPSYDIVLGERDGKRYGMDKPRAE